LACSAHREALVAAHGARLRVHVFDETLDLEVRGLGLLSEVLAVHFLVHADLSVGHADVGVAVARFFVCKLILIALLHVVAGAVAKVVGDHSVHGGWGPVAAAKSEGLIWQVGGLALHESKRNARIMRSPKVVLVVSGHGLSFQGHLVQFLEVTGILLSDV